MEQELREIGNRLMEQLREEYEQSDDGDFEYGMNNVEMLAVLYVTGTVGEAFCAVMEDIDDCVSNNVWWHK